MTKESLILLLLVGAAAVGILYAVKSASSNQGDWDQYQQIRLGESYASVKNRFSTGSEDFTSSADARDAGFKAPYGEAEGVGAVRMLVVRSREDVFLFGFDRDNRLVYKNFRDD